MKAVIGYGLAGLGLLGLALNSTVARGQISFMDKISSEYVLVPAAVLIVIGVVIMVMNSKVGGKIRQITEEVPIYQGEGKKRKVVGYRID
jgi:uncharacterized membrane protein